MLRLELPRRAHSRLRILFLGAHADDIEIGCGGTIRSLLDRPGAAEIEWVVFSGVPARALEARRSARALARDARTLRVSTKRFRDGFFPSQIARIKQEFETIKRRHAPDLIFCPWRGDAHQDHRLLGELTWNTFRDHLILEYEIPKYDGDLASPNLYVPLTREACRAKLEHLRRWFPSQADNQWFTDETFWGLLRLRGVECNSPTGYAEGFYCRKVSIDPAGAAPRRAGGKTRTGRPDTL
jgi:LmbE family N-acetylglucosaminyl deacetylase